MDCEGYCTTLAYLLFMMVSCKKTCGTGCREEAVGSIGHWTGSPPATETG